MALASISVFGGMMWRFLLMLGFTVVGLVYGAGQFPVLPGQHFIVAIYTCAFTCGS